MKIEIELPEIEGFSYTGEYRQPKLGESYIYNLEYGKGKVKECFVPAPSGCNKFIMKKLKPKREFKDGAFYPVVYGCDGLLDVVQYDGEKFESIHYNECSRGAFSWIGAELGIAWGEG